MKQFKNIIKAGLLLIAMEGETKAGMYDMIPYLQKEFDKLVK